VAPALEHGRSTQPLTERSAVDLACAIREQSVTAREVVEAHIALAREVDPKVRALAAEPFDDALTEADAADERVRAGGDLPPLLGVPCTIKESFALPAFFNGVFGHRPSTGIVPCRGYFPAPAGDGAARMLSAGPLARRAEDLMPFMRAVAGLDEEDPLSRDVELGDPAAVELGGLDVVLSDSASLKPVHRDVYAARERAAGALAAAGARVRREHLKGMPRAVELYLATLRDGAGDELSEISGSTPRRGCATWPSTPFAARATTRSRPASSSQPTGSRTGFPTASPAAPSPPAGHSPARSTR